MVERVSSLDDGYVTGDLSVFPEAIDTKGTLYEAKNNAETTLKQTLTFNGDLIIVEDATSFPSQGLVRIGPGPDGNAELVYYDKRTGTTFKDLIRGFAGSIQNKWLKGAAVNSSVMAESHNAVKDAVTNTQAYLGLAANPAEGSMNARLKALEERFLAPKPLFRAYPKKGDPPFKVRFQNFSGGDVVRYLWDFGDGTTSIEKSPTHTYQLEGSFTVKLNIITSQGAQGIAVKDNYIVSSIDERTPFFYIAPEDSSSPAYSIDTATSVSGTPATFNFVDQTDGDIVQRFWVFDDGTSQAVTDPNQHSTTHVYQSPGTYAPSLLIIFADERLKRVFLNDDLVVL